MDVQKSKDKKPTDEKPKDPENRDVLIIGAGPIGLLLGNLLGARGIDTLIVDKKSAIDSRSRAIGITPPSLGILDLAGLKEEFVNRGVPITDVKVHGKNRSDLGGINFSDIDSPTPFILSLPQQTTEELLLKGLKRYPTVKIEFNREVISAVAKPEGENGEIRTEVEILQLDKKLPEKRMISAGIVCGCDGFHSTVRKEVGLLPKGKRYRKTFVMGDFKDNTGWGSQVRLFFTPIGSVESFPLPGGERRWVIQTTKFLKEATADYLVTEINRRAGTNLSLEENINVSPFSVYRYILPRFYEKGIIFLGDSAHTISPIGGQGMNTGFGDVEFAAKVVDETLRHGWNTGLMNQYSYCRRKAAVAAAGRAQLSMGIGTIGGAIPSAWRNFWLKAALHTPLRKSLPKHYAMLTIPYNRLS